MKAAGGLLETAVQGCRPKVALLRSIMDESMLMAINTHPQSGNSTSTFKVKPASGF